MNYELSITYLSKSQDFSPFQTSIYIQVLDYVFLSLRTQSYEQLQLNEIGDYLIL